MQWPVADDSNYDYINQMHFKHNLEITKKKNEKRKTTTDDHLNCRFLCFAFLESASEREIYRLFVKMSINTKTVMK